MAKLNEKQKKFAREYSTDTNATQAAIRAGYSKNTAYSQGQRLLKHVEVKKLIDKATAKHAEKCGVTVESVTKMYKKAFKVGKDTNQSSGMSTAATGIAKLHGLVTDKHEHAGKDGGPIKTENQFVFNPVGPGHEQNTD
jgi:phage terminase small subunit